ncbi:MAG: sialate O-acetylesterase [Oscillatoria sp. SIO1A7]|nr:sialate O-acetylesterase [Oscillatoria sp. SIO1A7]
MWILQSIVFVVLTFVMTASQDLSLKLFILAGQSNMVGYKSNLEDLEPSQLESQDNVLWYDRSSTWVTLSPPTEPVLGPDLTLPVPPFKKHHPEHSHKVANGSGFGPEISLGSEIADNLKQKIALVKYARNGSNLAYQWNPDDDDSLYPRMKKRTNEAIAALKSLGCHVEIAGFFWMQGETDASNEDMAEYYQSNLTNFISALREDFHSPNLPFIYGMVHFSNDNSCCGEAVRTAQRQVEADVAFTSAVETRDLSLDRDKIHFDSKGTILLGDRFAKAWLTMTEPSK